MLKKMSKLTGFLSGFWHDETSQVSKIEILRVASILAVLSVAAMPRIASAYDCGWDPYCSNWYLDSKCMDHPECNCYKYYRICYGGLTQWQTCCQGQSCVCGAECGLTC